MLVLPTVLCAALVVGATPVERPPRPQPMRITADLEGTGRPATLRLNPQSADPVVVVSGGRTASTGIRRAWKPWRIAVSDLNGDGRREIVVALFKTTRSMPKPHNCLFVYRFDGRAITPLWLGSSMGRPFTDFAFGRIGDGGNRLVTLDIRMDGGRSVTVHRWTGFGFRAERSWGSWKRARLVGIGHGRISVVADGRRVSRTLEGSQ